MIAKYLFCVGFVFLLFDANYYSKRNSKNSVCNPDRFLKSFRFMAVFCFGLALLQAVVIHPFFPNWTMSITYLFAIAGFIVLRVMANRRAGPLCFQCRRAKEFLPFLILVGLTFFFLQIVELESDDVSLFSDSVASVFLMLVFLSLVGTVRLGFHQNGVHFGVFFIAWENVNFWKWKDRRPNYLILSSNLFLFPFAEMMLAADQREEARRLLEKVIPGKEQVSEQSLTVSGANQSKKFQKSSFFDSIG